MNIISLTPENIDVEHICCAIADKKSASGVAAKKDWLKARMNDGLRFKKMDVRGKAFIEYLPAENAWMPIDAPGYMLIDCHWVAGSFKGKGYGSELLAECERDASDMNGVVVTVGNKKRPFLSDKNFFVKHGYEVCDTAPPYFELLVKRLKPDAELPRFKPCAKQGMPAGNRGIDIFYTAQCPFTVPYINFLQPVIAVSSIPVRTHHITTKEEAQAHFCPVTAYSIFIDGKYSGNEILTPAKLEKLIAGMEE